ncbi:GerW family sporulation protein [Defluviitalea phaphyphila]|uniref:GerW family sporulation protein n=1 Tax=Defluviitalea phaphyphila TaxID=1473580 RepID=UPI002E8DDEA7|nr:spore germination protein GerW family protein [Defluviitalea phaphyphila]
MESNLKNSFEALFSQMEKFISTKTVVGEPVHVEGATILPLIDVSFGAGAGASEGRAERKDDKDAGGAGGGGLGAKITPSAILVIKKDGSVQLINVKSQDSVNKIIDMIPGILSKFNIGSKKDKEESEDEI